MPPARPYRPVAERWAIPMIAGSCVLISVNGLVIRSFDSASDWQIIFYRQAFFIAGLLLVLILQYRSKLPGMFRQVGWAGIGGAISLSQNRCSSNTDHRRERVRKDECHPGLEWNREYGLFHRFFYANVVFQWRHQTQKRQRPNPDDRAYTIDLRRRLLKNSQFPVRLFSRPVVVSTSSV